MAPGRQGATGGDQGVVLVPEGDINTPDQCRAVDQPLQAMLAAGARVVLVDMREVGHVSGAGLRLLLQATRRLRRLDGDLILYGLSPTLRRVLTLSSLDSEFAIASDAGQARALAGERLAIVHPAPPPITPAPEGASPGPAPESRPTEAGPPARVTAGPEPEGSPPGPVPPPPAEAEPPRAGRPDAGIVAPTEQVPSGLNLLAALVLQALGAGDTPMAALSALPPDRRAALEALGDRIERACGPPQS